MTNKTNYIPHPRYTGKEADITIDILKSRDIKATVTLGADVINLTRPLGHNPSSDINGLIGEIYDLSSAIASNTGEYLIDRDSLSQSIINSILDQALNKIYTDHSEARNEKSEEVIDSFESLGDYIIDQLGSENVETITINPLGVYVLTSTSEEKFVDFTHLPTLCFSDLQEDLIARLRSSNYELVDKSLLRRGKRQISIFKGLEYITDERLGTVLTLGVTTLPTARIDSLESSATLYSTS